MRNRLLLGLLGLFVLLAIGAGVRLASASKQAAAMAYPPTKVALASVTRSEVSRRVAGIGELEAVRQVQVAAESGGRVTRIAFESGQAVSAGQLLVQLNDAPEQAELIRAQAQLRNAEILHARMRKLITTNAVSHEQLDNAQAAREMALGALRHTQALIQQKAIRAPFDGVIGIRRVHQGQYLNPADAVASLADVRTLNVNFALDEQASPGLAVGQAVEVLVDAYPGQVFRAELSAIDPMITASRMVQVQARLNNGQGLLRGGMYARVRVTQGERRSVLTVPETAVTYTAYGESVFLAQPTDAHGWVARRVVVHVGERYDGRVEIDSGVSEADQVVTSGQIKLSDGMALQATVDSLVQPATGAEANDEVH